MSDYVRALREKIGNDFLLMPSVAALIRDDGGRILFVQHVEGRWQLPGGAIDPGERPAQAMQRECREEAGIEVEPIPGDHAVDLRRRR
jgi:8-oxo-dGTP pyrophosphatase MutT (NUDIX family)